MCKAEPLTSRVTQVRNAPRNRSRHWPVALAMLLASTALAHAQVTRISLPPLPSDDQFVGYTPTQKAKEINLDALIAQTTLQTVDAPAVAGAVVAASSEAATAEAPIDITPYLPKRLARIDAPLTTGLPNVTLASMPPLSIDLSERALQAAADSRVRSVNEIPLSSLPSPKITDLALTVALPSLETPTQDAPTAQLAQAPTKPVTIIRRNDPVGPADQPIESLKLTIIHALNDNPDIQIAKARQDDARYGIDEARGAWLPRVDVSVAAGGELNRPDEGDETREIRREASVTLRQNIWDFGLTLNDIRRARELYKSAEFATQEKIETIAFDISTAYIGVLERERIVDLTRENVAAHERILRMVSTQKELGLSTGADVSRVEQRLQNIKAALLDRESERDQARERYRRLVNRLPGRVVEPPAPDAALPPSPDDAVSLIDTRSPRLLQVLSDRRSVERQRASHRGNFFPKLEAEVQGNYKNDVSGDTNENMDARGMVVLRYNLFNGGTDLAIKRRIEARLRELAFDVDRTRREVEQDIRSDLSALKAAREKVATINSEVEAAQKVVDLYVEQFKTGKRTAFDLLDSQQALFAARTQQVGNQYAQVVSGYRVLQKLGMLFEHISEGDPAQKM
jgi:TolC family type I secretion outer membrane protein